jgi:O-antigen/teichoic acid export membrane protein
LFWLSKGSGITPPRNALMRLFSATLAPVITRLYGPEAFGLLALFTSITSISRVNRLHALRNGDHAPKDR